MRHQPYIKLIGAALALAACSLDLDEKHWRLAEEYQRQGQYQRAIEEYSRIVNLNPRASAGVRAQQRIALLFEEQIKDYPKAIRAYREVAKSADNARSRMMAQWSIARIYSEKFNNERAGADEYEKLFAEFGKSEAEGPEILLGWAKALVDSGQYAKASERYADFARYYPGHKEGPKALLEQGRAYLAADNPDKAIECFKQLIGILSGRDGFAVILAETQYSLGGAFEAKDDLVAALEAYQQSLSEYPNRSVVELKIQRVEKRKKERKL